MNAMQDYTVIVKNDTEQNGVAGLHWGVADENFFPPFVWLTTRVRWGKSSAITWTPQWQFVYAEVDQFDLPPILTPGEFLNADFNRDSVTLTYDASNGPAFKDLTRNPFAIGALEINCDETVPQNGVAAGIGMADAVVGLRMCWPNSKWAWNPEKDLTLWIAFHETFTTGQLLDTTIIGETAVISFPPNVYSLTAVLNRDGSWTIAPTPA